MTKPITSTNDVAEQIADEAIDLLSAAIETIIQLEALFRACRKGLEFGSDAARLAAPGEQLLAQAQAVINVERQQAEQQIALERIETRVASVEQVRYLDSRPAGFESMTTIRERISLRHGMPPWVINAVMRDIPGAPLPFAMVRSKHADDGAQPYPIWPTADITRRFDRFAAECTFVTAERATHPDIQQGRFKLRPRNSA